MRNTQYALALVPICSVLLGACSEIQDLVSTDPSEFLTLSVAASSLPADGVAHTTVTAWLSPAAGNDREVTFRTSKGGLLEQDDTVTESVVLADIDGHAVVELVAPVEIGETIVEASNGTIARTVRVEFVRAYPDTIAFELDTPILGPSAGFTTGIIAILARGLGAVTPGLVPEFRAIDSRGNAIGSIDGQRPSDDLGEASAIFTVDPSFCAGDPLLVCPDPLLVVCPIEIIGRVPNQAGQTIEARVTVFVDPCS